MSRRSREHWLWVLTIGVLLLIFRPRVFVGLLVLAAVAALSLYVSLQHDAALREAEEKAAARTITPEQIELLNLHWAGTFGSASVTGRVRNNSPYKLTSVALEITLQDCVPKERCGERRQSDCRCDTIYDEQASMNFDFVVPPGQARDFEVYLPSGHDLRPQGDYSWSYRIIGIKGRAP